MKPEIICIWAQDRNGVIGINNALPWHLPPDLARFRKLTWGDPIIMGRKTFAALPHKPLTGRKNIVLTTSAQSVPKDSSVADRDMAQYLRNDAVPSQIAIEDFSSIWAKKIFWASSFTEAFQICDAARRIWVIGGAKVFSQIIEQAHRLEITYLDIDVRKDAYINNNIGIANSSKKADIPDSCGEVSAQYCPQVHTGITAVHFFSGSNEKRAPRDSDAIVNQNLTKSTYTYIPKIPLSFSCTSQGSWHRLETNLRYRYDTYMRYY